MVRLLSLHPLAIKKDPLSDLTLFWVPGGMALMLDVEGSIALALKLRGQNVHAIICDGAYKACIRREITDQVPLARWSEQCKKCKKECSDTLNMFNIKHSYIGDYISSDQIKKIRTIADKATLKNVEAIKFQDVVIGKNIKSAVLRYLKGFEFSAETNPILREYSFSGLICAEAAKNAYIKLSPARIIMSHGTYVDWGPALKIAKRMAIPIIGWMASYLPARFYFRTLDDSENIDFHKMSDGAWDAVVDEKFTEEKNITLDGYLKNRYLHDSSFDMREFQEYSGNLEMLRSRYALDSKRPVWGIVAHINWDAVSDYAPMWFESFNEWIIQTIDEISLIKDVQWIIKIHPAEAWDNPKTGVERLVNNSYPKLPDHIHLLGARENISPLDFICLVDGGITVYGTAGLEMALMGKPVILAGEAYYGKKGFTFDLNSKGHYMRLLHNCKDMGVLRDDQITLAKKYAYVNYISKQIPIEAVRNPSSKWWSFQINKRSLLLPNRDPVMDFLCKTILSGEEFLLPDRLIKNIMKT
jgi:hypothetical protein